MALSYISPKSKYARYDKGWELFREDMARRRTRMLLAIVGMIGLGIAVLGFIG